MCLIISCIVFFCKNTSDMLWWYTVPTPPNLVSSTLANVGKMRNQGIEIGINAVPVRTKDFEWKTTATFATKAYQKYSCGKHK